MIDCLSNPSWINPQIDFLLFLQNMRLGRLEVFDELFLSVTLFGEFMIPAILSAIVYWCIDIKAGMYLFSLEGFNVLLAHFFKMLACVYRPWILSSDIHPSSLALPFAKGYSFPSGHSAMSSSVFGGAAYLLRKHKVISLLLVCLVLLIGFSRLWLGVHTPQDVIGGFAIGLILIFTVNKIIDKAEENKNLYLYLIGIINVFAVLALIYICYFNTYRLDYVSGELLVNPTKSIYITCIVYGYILGLLNGCFISRRFCPFKPKDTSVKIRIIRGLIGSFGILLMMKYVLKNIVVNVYAIKPTMLITFSMGITITLIYPLIFTYVEKHFLKNKNLM